MASETTHQDVSLERSRFESKKRSSVLLIRPEKCNWKGPSGLESFLRPLFKAELGGWVRSRCAQMILAPES